MIGPINRADNLSDLRNREMLRQMAQNTGKHIFVLNLYISEKIEMIRSAKVRDAYDVGN